MTSQTIYLYSSAVTMIGVLVAFSKNNRKNGWKKSRTTLVEALHELYSDLGLTTDLSNPPTGPLLVNSADFTSQLLSLRGALGVSKPISSNPVVVKQVVKQADSVSVLYY